MVNFPTWITDCDSHSLGPLDLFISSDFSICSTVAFLPMRISDHALVSVPIDFSSNAKGDAPFHRTVCGYFLADWDGLLDHLRDFLL